MHELIAAAVVGYVPVNDPDLRKTLKKKGYTEFQLPAENFWGVWNNDLLICMLREANDEILEIQGKWFARNESAVQMCIQAVKEIDCEEKQEFEKRVKTSSE